MRAGYVPTERIAPVLALLIRERWPQGGGLDVLAEKVGCDWGTIAGIIDQENPGVSFDLADRLISTGLGRWDLWHGELADIYPEKFMETCAAPGCGKRFPEYERGGIRKKYCSRRCNATGSNIRRGLGSGKNRMGVCRRGHRLTVENSVSQNGRRTCRICRSERHRKWAAEKRKDPGWRERRNEAQRRWRAKAAA